MLSIFDFLDYKLWLNELIRSQPKNGHGVRARLASAIQCQMAYVSHVLVGARDFNQEQALGVARFFGLNDLETDFFLALLNWQRSGSKELKEYWWNKLSSIKNKSQEFKNRMDKQIEITPEVQAIYYSSWHYQAVRVGLYLPQNNSLTSISKFLNLPLERVKEVLKFLKSCGLVEQTKNGYISTQTKLHLSGDSPLVARLHSNWRTHTLTILDRKNTEDLHYSALITLSEEDYSKVREILMKGVLATHKIIEKSDHQRVCLMALDFYSL